MNIFIYEHICGGGFAEREVPNVLRQEGWAMLNAIVADFAALPDVNVATSLDRRFAAEKLPAKTTLINTVHQAKCQFDQLTTDADWTLVIAPEFDDILYRLTVRVEQLGGRLLGSTPDAVRLGADKLTLADHWARHNVATIPTQSIDLGKDGIPSADFPAVLKPRYGAGSVQTYLLRDQSELDTILAAATDEDLPHPAIHQPYIEGDPISMSFLVGAEQIIPMPPTRQILTDDGRFAYLGGEGPLEGPDVDAARDLAHRAVQSVEGLRGYVGVDLILAPAGPVVVELNPRLSTSYIGLRRMCEQNLAKTILDLANDQQPDPLGWTQELIRFTTEGQLDKTCVR